MMVVNEFIEFSKALLETEDLDPIYVMLNKSKMSKEEMRKWLVAYWCFYDSGVASMAAEASDYYDEMCRLIEYAPRGTERRHFRGEKAKKAIKWMQSNDMIGEVFDELQAATEYKHVVNCTRKVPMFGTWITFKVADMLERLSLAKVSFTNFNITMYREPMKGVGIVLYNNEDAFVSQSEVTALVVSTIVALGSPKAPPLYDRVINMQEVETMLCKYKSHTHGHYNVGKDTKELKHSLIGRGRIAEELYNFVKEI